MQKKSLAFWERTSVKPYWFLIIALLLILAVVFGYHLVTERMPSAAAVSIGGFSIYWYGILIVGGIALGAYVVSDLATDRALALFNKAVPARIQAMAVAALNFPAAIQESLDKLRIATIGHFLLQWGYNPRNLGFKDEETAVVEQSLGGSELVQKEWINNAPWKIWNPDHVWNGLIICMIFGVIGARLYHVLTPSPSMAAIGIESPLDYFQNPAMLFNLRAGGLGIYGGLAGGALGLWIYSRWKKIPMLAWADIAVVGVALGQVFGRWGNFFNQELYGRPTTLPWAIYIEPTHRLPAFAQFDYFHPAFLYESLWNLLAFIVLFTLAKKYAKSLLVGELTALYLIFYAVGRILLEMVRLDSRTMTLGSLDLNMAVATFVSLVIAAAMAAWVIIRRLRLKNEK